MDQERLLYLVRRYQLQEETEAEGRELVAVLSDPEMKEQLDQALEQSYFLMTAEELQELDQKRSTEIVAGILKAHPRQAAEKPRRSGRLFYRAAAIAAVFAGVVLGTWLLDKHFKRQHEAVRTGLAINDREIIPGGRGAMLTLANGKTIRLDSTKRGLIITEGLKYDDGSEVTSGDPATSEEKNGLALRASTTKGQTYEFTLPDGTHVWLNADSKLDFAFNMNKMPQRIVRLQGEGYFEAAKDRLHPFIVETRLNAGAPLQRVEVLGTHFNVSAYPEENAGRTTLVEGSVRVSFGKEELVIRPGQQALAGGDALKMHEVDTETYTAWKDNKFIFEDVDIRSIMRTVARWYNVDVVYERGLTEQDFWLRSPRYSKISVLLKDLESTGKVKFRIEGRTIYVR